MNKITIVPSGKPVKGVPVLEWETDEILSLNIYHRKSKKDKTLYPESLQYAYVYEFVGANGDERKIFEILEMKPQKIYVREDVRKTLGL